jgi:dolichol-phosphate mannosyltransferase
MKNSKKISVIIPIFNEEGNIKLLIERTLNILDRYSDYELIFVDDGSTDKTLKIILEERVKENKIKYLSFSRNFGHQHALRAGLDFATGDCVISMDGDLQHPPELIHELIQKWQDGYDVVYTIRKDDPKISFFKRKTSSCFYYFMNKFSDVRFEKGAADFRLLDRKVVDILKTMREGDLFMRGMVSWLGFKQFGISYIPEERNWGKTKYTYSKMLKFAITGVTSFSVKPLYLSTFLGYLIAGVSFLYGLYAIYMKIFTQNTMSGWTSVFVAVLFIGGVQMIMIGILGGYLGKLFIESKKRPNYIIKEKSL